MGLRALPQAGAAPLFGVLYPVAAGAPAGAATVQLDEAAQSQATTELVVEGFVADMAVRTGYASLRFAGGSMARNRTGLPSMLDRCSGPALDGRRALHFLLPYGSTIRFDRPVTAFGPGIANLGTAGTCHVTLTE